MDVPRGVRVFKSYCARCAASGQEGRPSIPPPEPDEAVRSKPVVEVLVASSVCCLIIYHR